ncbi:hypothetical protein D3C87_1749470 [compost metagenome]
MQRAQQDLEGFKRLGDVAGLLGLGVGLVHHLDVEIEARLFEVCQRPAGDVPVGRVHKGDDHGGEVAPLAEHAGGQVQQGFCNAGRQLGRALGRHFDVEDGHRGLLLKALG